MTLPVSDSTNWNDLLKAHVLTGHNADGTHKLSEITEYKILTFTRNMTAAAGDVATTGAGFTPRQVMFFAAVNGNSAASWGFDDGTDSESTSQSHNGDMSSDSSNSSIFIHTSGTSPTDSKQHAVIKTLDVDGFTLTWSKSSSPSGTATIIAICFK